MVEVKAEAPLRNYPVIFTQCTAESHGSRSPGDSYRVKIAR